MKLRIPILVCAVVCLSFVVWSSVSSDSTESFPSQFVHDVWQTDRGLPQNSVVAIVQTRDSYIWLATQEGLVRFDGIRFTVFDKRTTPQIKENNIQALYEDREGSLWAGTEGGGLVRLKDGKFTAFTTQDGLADNIVDALYEDREGNLWIGTLGGLSRFKDGVFTNFTTKDGLPKDTVLSICEDRSGNLWIGTDDGLSRLKDSRFTSYTTEDGLANNLVRAVCEDREGNLWIGTQTGLSRFKDGRFTNFTTKDGLVNDGVLTVYEDREGDLWIGTRGGLAKRKDGHFSSYTMKEGLSENNVASICEDREGNLWIGTYEGGLNRLKEGRFTVYARKDGLAGDIVRPVFEDSKGDLWIGTASGLSRWSGGKITNYTTKDGLADDNVLALCEDRSGDLWIGTSGGLNRFSNERLTSYTTKKGLSDNTVLSLCDGRDGSVWIGTANGLNRLENETITTYTTSNGLTNASIWSLLKDTQEAVWIGTDGGGLNRLKDGKFTAFTTNDGLANDIVLSIHEDSEGALWIGTSGGLSRMKNGVFASYTTEAGLFDDVVFQVLEDARANLWMSCNKGVFRVSKQELEDFSQGRTRAINSISYGTADGMKSRECNGGFQPAGWRTRDGRLWFPTVKGVAVIDPENITVNQLAPAVMIERVLVDHEQIDAIANAELAPGKGKFEFHYTGLSFVAPEKVRFKYKLEGFDKSWVDAGTQREAVYTNIPPGSYAFRVIACNNDGVWNETGTAFSFYLKPHFYQTYLFYTLCAANAVLIGLGLYRLRVKHIEAQFSAVLGERNRMAREIHDTLAQGFAGISLQLEAVDETLSDSPDVARRHLNRARTLVRSSLAEARRSVWELHSQALDQAGLATALSTVAEQLTPGTSIQTRVKLKGNPRRLSSVLENNLLHIGREALTNAVKHARAAKIDVELEFKPKSVALLVKDNGCGFDTQNRSSRDEGGFGLISMRERADQIGAVLNIQSIAGEGTEVAVEVSG